MSWKLVKVFFFTEIAAVFSKKLRKNFQNGKMEKLFFKHLTVDWPKNRFILNTSIDSENIVVVFSYNFWFDSFKWPTMSTIKENPESSHHYSVQVCFFLSFPWKCSLHRAVKRIFSMCYPYLTNGHCYDKVVHSEYECHSRSH